MNPNCAAAVAYRAESYHKLVAIRDRLAGEVAAAPDCPDVESKLIQAETDVRATLSRMVAMGDPDPEPAAPAPPAALAAPMPAAQLATAPAPPAAEPNDARPTPATIDPADVVARRILEA